MKDQTKTPNPEPTKKRASTYERPLKLSGGFVEAVKALVRKPKTKKDK